MPHTARFACFVSIMGFVLPGWLAAEPLTEDRVEVPALEERGLRLPPPRPAKDAPLPNAKRLELTGDWLLTMVGEFEFDVRIEPDDRPNFFVLRLPGSNIAGVYELKGNRLEMSRPEDGRYVGLVWEAKNANTLILIEHPETSRFSADYTGATLGRQKKVSPPLVRGGK
jgi:hypothetical protein